MAHGNIVISAELEKIHKQSLEKDNEAKDVYYNTKTPYRRQALAALGTVMLNCGVGATAGFSAVLIPQLKHGRNRLDHKLNTEMESWVAAAASFALIFGNLISGYLMERYGRRSSQIMLSIPYMAGWAIIAFADNIYLVLLGRFITGFCQGWLGPLGSVFVGEVSSPLNRSVFLAGLSLAIAFGVFMSHLFGTLMHWKYAAILCGLFPLMGCILTYCVKESPTWLASKNRIDDCIESFQWYRGTSPEMKNELDKIIFEQSQRDQSKSKLKTLLANIRKPEFWKPLCIMIVFFILTQLTGVNVICAYTTEMMKELIGNHANRSTSSAAMLSIDILRCVSLVVACFLLRKLGRRPMALFSGASTCLTLIALSGYLYLVNNRVIRHISPFVSLSLIAIYIIVSNFGVVPLPWNMVGELFATETRGLGSGFSVMTTSVAYFGTIKTAPAMFESIGHHGTYLFYGLSTMLGTIFLFFCLPETRGKTLIEIEEHFRNSKQTKTKPVPDDGTV
ncbi:facilitated trehalose transporter Tret1-like [Cydia fagiglandana]|uniref:facilitated trehalose transporter Tret1-like n=1 Tax=Cydia fagiglandana TaxID=1458189 RepID=UPI002FEE0FAB